jgi:hypothetical protein
MAPRDGVKIGGVQIMGGDVPPQSSEEKERQRRIENIVRGAGGSALSDPFGLGGYFDLVQQGLESNRQATAEPVVGRNMPGRVPTNPQVYGLAGRTAGTGIPGQGAKTETITRQDVLNKIMAELGLLGGGGGGAARPDYSAYRSAITDQAQQLNAQIQAMYNTLAEQAGSNVGRIQDIYGGATAGIEAGYGSAAENIAQAYQSAQQQAADQMARLGIEEAAGQVLPSQALSQAEAVAGLEAGRAGGLSAAERYGASGAQFGSEMAQVAQQQGTEMNAAILAALQNRLNESLLAEAQGAAAGGGGGRTPSVSDMLRLQEYADEVYRRDVLGEIPLNERELAVRMAEQEASAQARFASDIAADAIKIAADNPDMSFEEAQAAALALRQIPQ